MGNSILGTSKKTKERVLDVLSGKMEENMKDSGLLANSTETGFIEMQKERRKEENGLREKGLNGLNDMNSKFRRVN